MIDRTNNDEGWAAGDPDRVLRALRRGFLQAVREHRLTRDPMVFWEDGRVVEIPADQLPDPDAELAASDEPGGSPDTVS